MKPTELMAEIIQAGGSVRAAGDRLKFRAVPARLIPHIRENKAALLALLSSQPFVAPLPSEECPDAYAMAERRAIQAESYPCTTPAEKMRHGANTAPSRVSCGTCARFQPDAINPSQGVGRCGVTEAGPPPGGSGYGACFPMAPRTCLEFAGVQR